MENRTHCGVYWSRTTPSFYAARVKLKFNPQSRTAGTDNKPGYIDLLLKYRSDKVMVSSWRSPVRPKSKRSKRSAASRRTTPSLLMNILFSEGFVHRMSEADKNPTRAALDNRAINEGSPYWKDVTRAYNEDGDKYKGLAKARAQYQAIYPEQAVEHSTAKLMDMWKKLTSRYTVTCGKSKLSGHNERDFFSYCKGRVDLLYLHDWVGIHPGQLSKVIGRISKKAQMSTLGVTDSDEGDAGRSSAEETTGNKRRRMSAVERIASMLEVEHKGEMEERHSSYEAVTRSSAAVQSALKTLTMMKYANASDELILQAQQKVDALVLRWMDEMDPK